MPSMSPVLSQRSVTCPTLNRCAPLATKRGALPHRAGQPAGAVYPDRAGAEREPRAGGRAGRYRSRRERPALCRRRQGGIRAPLHHSRRRGGRRARRAGEDPAVQALGHLAGRRLGRKRRGHQRHRHVYRRKGAVHGSLRRPLPGAARDAELLRRAGVRPEPEPRRSGRRELLRAGALRALPRARFRADRRGGALHRRAALPAYLSPCLDPLPPSRRCAHSRSCSRSKRRTRCRRRSACARGLGHRRPAAPAGLSLWRFFDRSRRSLLRKAATASPSSRGSANRRLGMWSSLHRCHRAPLRSTSVLACGALRIFWQRAVAPP